MVSTLDQPYQNVGVVIRRGRMDELAGRLVPLLRAVRAGIDRYYNDKAFTMKVIAKYTKENDPDIIDRTYEFYRKAGFRARADDFRARDSRHPGLSCPKPFRKRRKPRRRSSSTIASCANLTAENSEHVSVRGDTVSAMAGCYQRCYGLRFPNWALTHGSLKTISRF